MILKAFCLLDTKTGAFGTPFFMHHVGAAVRACIDIGQDMNTQVGRHPADFVLCQVGEWDDQSGQFSGSGILQVGAVVQFLPRQPALDFAGSAPATGPRVAPSLNGLDQPEL